MKAENPVYSSKLSDLNSTIILFLELEIIFLSQLLTADRDLGPLSEPVILDNNVEFPSYIRIKSPSKLELNCQLCKELKT